VIPRENSYTTFREALYRLLVQGLRRLQGNRAQQHPTLGSFTSPLRQFYNGRPAWRTGDGRLSAESGHRWTGAGTLVVVARTSVVVARTSVVIARTSVVVARTSVALVRTSVDWSRDFGRLSYLGRWVAWSSVGPCMDFGGLEWKLTWATVGFRRSIEMATTAL